MRKGMSVGNDREGDDCAITAHVPLNNMFGYSTALPSMTQEEELSDSFGFGDKRKVIPHEAPDKENAKRPAITGLLDASLASRFLSDPPITDMCDELAKDEFVVKMARQLLEALQASTVLEDGTFNDSAFEHFALVMRIWRNMYFNAKINLVLVKNCIVPDIIDKLSNEVGNEQIGERMCRIKADHNLSDILQLKRPPATMIRGLLIILLGYWSYKKLPLPVGFDDKLMCFDGDCGDKVAEDEPKIIELDLLEEHNTWLLEHGTPIQKLESELFIDELANDLKYDSRLFAKTQQCMDFLHIFDPKDDGTLFCANLHHDLAHEVLEDPHFLHLLVETLKVFEGHALVIKYGERAKVGNEDVLATVKNIVKDPGFHQYKNHIEKNDVRAAMRVFLSILIVHWMYDDVLKKVNAKLLDDRPDEWKATGYDDVVAEICYVTRFAGDLKGLREALGKVYGTRPYKHVFDSLKITLFHGEVIGRKKQFHVTVEMEVYLYHSGCCGTRLVHEHELNED